MLYGGTDEILPEGLEKTDAAVILEEKTTDSDKGGAGMRHMILGTDWWTDCDDAVAIRLLARAHRAGEISLDAVYLDACMDYSLSSLDGFLQAEGIGDIPVAIDREATDFGGHPRYQENMARYAKRYRSNEEGEDAARFLRRMLAEAAEPVEILEIGYPQVLASVLESKRDALCPWDGTELFRHKVRKLWMMAGKWDEEGGRENNFARNPRSRKAARIVCEKCPVPITFLGWEIGNTVITGGNLQEGDILKQILTDHGSANGRMSWDPMLCLLAVTGDEGKAGYAAVRGTARVDETDGANYFTEDPNGLHSYVKKTRADDWYRDRIEEKIRSDPREREDKGGEGL